jgi:probable rRNA maturation factor
LEAEGQQGVWLAVTFTDDQGIRELNDKYRGIDRATDVLAFAMSEGPAFVLPSSELRDLGDVIISLPRAQCQAEEHHTNLQGEVALLVVHGCLHLLGYDHAEIDDEQRMWARQAAILATIS